VICMAKAVIFDWDGTLADTKKAVMNSFQTVLTKSGCKVSNEFIVRRIGIGTKKTIIDAFRECNIRLDVATLEKLTDEKVNIQAEFSDSVYLFEGITELLKELQRKTKIALATMSSRKVIDRLLQTKRLKTYFDVVISADDVTYPKPNSEIFLMAAKKMGFSPTDCVVIEDSVFGLRAAKAANIKCIAVSSGAYTKNELEREQPDMIVNSLCEKERILDFVFNNK
jgi:beta-phosphoglucomutase